MILPLQGILDRAATDKVVIIRHADGTWLIGVGYAFPTSQDIPNGALFWRVDLAAFYKWVSPTKTWNAVATAGGSSITIAEVDGAPSGTFTELRFDSADGLVLTDLGGGVARLDFVAAAGAGAVPIGGIIMWSGTIASIPATWALCDGTANAPGPDLRDKFVVGAKQDDLGVAKTNIEGSLKQSGGVSGHSHSGHANLTHAGLTIGDHTGLTHGLTIANHPDLTHAALSHAASTFTHADHSVPSQSHTHAAFTLTHADISLASFTGSEPAFTLTHADQSLASFSGTHASQTGSVASGTHSHAASTITGGLPSLTRVEQTLAGATLTLATGSTLTASIASYSGTHASQTLTIASGTHSHAAATETIAAHSVASASHTHAASTITQPAHSVASSTGTQSAATLTHADHSFPSLSHQAIGTHVGTDYGVHTFTAPAAHGAAGTLTHSFSQENDHAISAHDTVLSLPNYYALAFIQRMS